MKSDDAVAMLTAHVRKTGVGASEAVRTLWDKIMPINDPDDLIAYALASRVAVAYKHGGDNGEVEFAHAGPGSSMGRSVNVSHRPYHGRNYVVSVEILSRVHYNVGGKVKAVLAMGVSDLQTLSREAEAQANGWLKYKEQVWDYAASRLKTLKKSKIEDLAEGEQLKIAKRLAECQKRLPPQSGKSLAE